VEWSWVIGGSEGREVPRIGQQFSKTAIFAYLPAQKFPA
jgi:hypothetical protein